jgi:hypothetical protein
MNEPKFDVSFSPDFLRIIYLRIYERVLHLFRLYLFILLTGTRMVNPLPV